MLVLQGLFPIVIVRKGVIAELVVGEFRLVEDDILGGEIQRVGIVEVAEFRLFLIGRLVFVVIAEVDLGDIEFGNSFLRPEDQVRL